MARALRLDPQPVMKRAELHGVEAGVQRMADLVQDALERAMAALESGDLDGARQVAAGDLAIDRLEEEIERECLRLLGVHSHAGPAEREIRRIAAVYKLVTDLERMGDHAAAIARSTLRMHGERPISPFIDIQRLAALTGEMVAGAVAAFFSADAEAARLLAERDDGVDALYDQVFRELLTYMLDDRPSVRQATHLLFVANSLERIADHATNISEWAIFVDTGQRVELND